jgi:hypothetical protein
VDSNWAEWVAEDIAQQVGSSDPINKVCFLATDVSLSVSSAVARRSRSEECGPKEYLSIA